MKLDLEAIERYTDMVVKSDAPDLGIPREACLVDGVIEPCVIVIFGATGDLTSRKLVPALYDLFISECLPENFLMVGAGRSIMNDAQFRERIGRSLTGSTTAQREAFSARLFYQPIDFDSEDSFVQLAAGLQALDREHKTGGNKLLYLAIPPSLYKSVVRMIGRAGLWKQGVAGHGWSRIVVEKPFGNDLETSIELNGALREYFAESQIFRIDHYLAKETVQNVLMFRFANTIFEPLWNRMFIDRVHITAVESLGVEKRAVYYEEAGVVRDMFQNHMMQLLAVTAMEPPARFQADMVRDETVKIFRSLRPLNLASLSETVVLGQYDSGVINGEEVPGYREERGVTRDSLTPTFAMMKVFVDNWRWQGVPFYLTSGKRLKEKLTEIIIHFKNVPHSLFQGTIGETISPNLLTLGIYPDEKINLTFQTKNPGARVCLRSVTMDFNYKQNYSGPELDAYEKAILDCMQGDQTLFWRQDAVELCWAFLTPLIQDCETCADRQDRLSPYAAGSWGPDLTRIWRQ